jgi:hypothetical protein
MPIRDGNLFRENSAGKLWVVLRLNDGDHELP